MTVLVELELVFVSMTYHGWSPCLQSFWLHVDFGLGGASGWAVDLVGSRGFGLPLLLLLVSAVLLLPFHSGRMEPWVSGDNRGLPALFLQVCDGDNVTSALPSVAFSGQEKVVGNLLRVDGVSGHVGCGGRSGVEDALSPSCMSLRAMSLIILFIIRITLVILGCVSQRWDMEKGRGGWERGRRELLTLSGMWTPNMLSKSTNISMGVILHIDPLPLLWVSFPDAKLHQVAYHRMANVFVLNVLGARQLMQESDISVVPSRGPWSVIVVSAVLFLYLLPCATRCTVCISSLTLLVNLIMCLWNLCTNCHHCCLSAAFWASFPIRSACCWLATPAKLSATPCPLPSCLVTVPCLRLLESGGRYPFHWLRLLFPKMPTSLH